MPPLNFVLVRLTYYYSKASKILSTITSLLQSSQHLPSANGSALCPNVQPYFGLMK